MSVHQLMDRIEVIDSEVGLPFSWFLLMTHGHWVEPDVGLAIAEGLKAQRARLPAPDTAVLGRADLWILRRAVRTSSRPDPSTPKLGVPSSATRSRPRISGVQHPPAGVRRHQGVRGADP